VGAFRKVLVHRNVIVNLVDGTSITGVLYRDPGPLLVLKNAEYLAPGADPVSLDGDTVIERTKVLFVQAP